MVTIGNYQTGKDQPLTLIAGPCVIENREMILSTARELCRMTEKYPVQLVFKSSYKKANRTSVKGFTGINFTEALQILEEVRSEFSIPVLTDVHTELEIPVVAEIADVLQIPAFLSRQTDLLISAGRTGRTVNIKKGQFMAPDDMKNAADKVATTGNRNILLTERGTTFGYHNLVVDMRNLSIMAGSGYPIVYDATHSVQLPGGEGHASGGQPEFILPLARAAIATGTLSAVFMEVHPEPARALSDARSQLGLKLFPRVLEQLVKFYQLAQELRSNLDDL